MKRTLALIMSAIIICSALVLTGCGPTDEQLIVGEWEYVWEGEDLAALLEEEGIADEAAGFDFSKLADLVIVFEFDKDGTAECYVTEDSAEEFLDSIFEGVIPILINTVSEEAGRAVTEDEVYSLLEMTKEEVKAQTLEGVEIDDILGELTYENGSEFTLEDGELYIGDEYIGEYTIDGDELIITDDDIELVFERQ